MGRAVNAHTSRCSAYLMGRGLYEQWSTYWPTNETDDFKDFINPIQKYVLSTTLDAADWENTQILRPHAEEQGPDRAEEQGRLQPVVVLVHVSSNAVPPHSVPIIADGRRVSEEETVSNRGAEALWA